MTITHTGSRMGEPCAFFIALDDEETLDRIRQVFPDVQPPQFTTYPVPEWDQYVLLLWLYGG
ncbi:MAG: hypothetical protein SF123_14785 [Chloroflexota bacterium]|nr:hypothetical protein [Chloroflexota bacterium]